MRNKSLLHAAVASLALIGATAAQAQTYSNAVMSLTPPPVGYWPLQETTPPPTPGSLNLTAHNSGTLGTAGDGLYGAWYQASGASWYVTNTVVLTNAGFTGDSSKALWCQSVSNSAVAGQYVVVPHTTNGVLNDALTLKPPFSVECWAYIRSINSAARILVAQGTTRTECGGSDPNNQFNGGTFNALGGFELLQYQDYISFMTDNTNAITQKASLQTSVYNTYTGFKVGQLVHIVATLDETGHKAIYTNGVLCASQNLSANKAGLKYVPDTVSPIMIGSGPELPISTCVPTESVYSPYSGVLDDVAIYTNALTEAQATAHYQAAASGTYAATVQADNPLLFYRFDDSITPGNAGYNTASFPTANNYGSEGANANGLYQPGTTPGVAGPSYTGFGANSRAVALNGAFGTVNIGNGNLPASLNPTGAVPVTVVSWFKGGPADSPNRYQEILGHGTNSYRLGLGWGSSSGTQVGHHFNPGPGPELSFDNIKDETTNGFALNDGKWHMVAGVSDGINDYLYLDGRLAKSGSNPSGINIVGNTNDLILGGDPHYTYAATSSEYTIRNYNGRIAHVAVWTNALSLAQIQNLYIAAGVPPTIAQQPPAATNVNAGTALSVAVVARDIAPLTYQWYKNGSALSTQTTATLTLNPVQLSDAGTYYVKVSNATASTTSSSMTLTVNGPPVLSQQSPTDVRVFVGTQPVLHATVTGPSPAYQWSKNGSPIPGATQSAYPLSRTTDTGATGSSSYSCSITNAYGSAGGFQSITVQVLAAPTTPYPQRILADSPVAFFRLDEPDNGSGLNNGVTAYDYAGGCNAVYTNTTLGQASYSTATDPTETSALFGWSPSFDSFAGNGKGYLDFATASGNNAEFSVEAWINAAYVPNSDAGVVTIGYGYGGEQFALDCGGKDASNHRALRFYVTDAGGTSHGVTAPNSSSIWGDGLWHHVVAVCDEAGGQVSLYLDGVLQNSAAISAGAGLQALTVPLSIGARLPNNTTNSYQNQFVGNINEVSLYNYALTPSQVASHYASVGVAPTITQAPPSTVVTNEGATVVLTAQAVGTEPLHYQWQLNYVDIPGATTNSLTLNNVTANMNGNVYVLNVNNAYGSATTATTGGTTLQVNSGTPQIAVNLSPLQGTNYVGGSMTYSVTVTGTQPFTYQWYQDGSPVGANSSSYTFTVLGGQHTYRVHVSNSYGGVDSSTATLSGMVIPTLNPANYAYHVPITFVGYNRSEVLADFPALVVMTNIPGFAYSQMADPTGGGDLRFTDASGTRELPYEIDEWNPAGNSTVWVQVPKLGTNTDSIVAYWGNPGATTPDAWSTNGTVWLPPIWEGHPSYLAVYHLKESALPFADSTLQFPATNGVPPTPGAGIVGTGGVWSSGGYLDPGPITKIDGAFTLSAWVNISSSVTDIQDIFSEKGGGWNANGFSLFVNTYQTHDGSLHLETGDGVGGDASYTAGGVVSFGQWHLLTAVVDKNNNKAYLYVDGAFQPSKGVTFNGFAITNDINLGRGITGSFPLQGTMDEARICGSTNSANWVWADYMTVAQNATFEQYGAVSGPPVLTAQVSGGYLVLTWTSGTLISSSSLSTPQSQWQPVAGATSPYSIPLPPTGQARFFRVRVP